MKLYTVKTTSKRDVDHVVTLEAKDEKELSKIVFGLDFGFGFPDDYDIINQEEKAKSYVIIETKVSDRFEEILPEHTTLDEAKEKARKARECIVAADRATIELVYVDVTEDGIIDPCNNGYNPIPF